MDSSISSKNSNLTVAERLMQCLSDLGVRYIFGIPGGSWMPYMQAMRTYGIEFILTANEASAGIMADVCARITGIPGVCHGTLGPGATNLTTGVGCAYLDRSPLIALTSEPCDGMLNRKSQMHIDHQALFAPITKWTTRLSRDNVAGTVHKAMQIAMSEVPGSVHIGLPIDLADQREGEAPAEPLAYEPLASEGNSTLAAKPDRLPPPDVKLLEKVEQLLGKAKKPIFAVGLTAARLKLNDLLLTAAQKHMIPVILTPMAKGMLPEDHHCYAGVLFHALSDHVALTYRQADLIVGIGYDPVEFNYEQWMPDVPLIHLDSSPADIDNAYNLACDVVGDLRQSLDHIAGMDPVKSDWDLDALSKRRAAMFELLKSDTFGPIAALTILREIMPQDGIMTCDVGAHTHLIGQMWHTPAPGLQIMTNGWSSMGFGVPAAIAAKFCLSDRAVACVSGDGGFLMMAGEMMTARRLNLNVVFVVLADEELGLIHVKQERKGHKHYGTRLYKGDLFASDCIFGVPILTARSHDEMCEALSEAFAADGPIVVEAVIDGTEYERLIAREHK
jgi:acetolactate synthase-1/2/3 large subunit